jgi:WD40 repeat protein
VLCVAFKPDNPNILVSCSDDKTIKMWDITSGSCVSTVIRGVRSVTFNGTGDTLVTGCGNGNIFFIDAATSQVREQSLTGHRYVPSLSKAYFLHSFGY